TELIQRRHSDESAIERGTGENASECRCCHCEFLHQNCCKTRRSFSKSVRMFGMSNLIIAARSRPKPNANPLHSSGSMPTLRSTCGWIMPLPRISIHPVKEQVLHPLPRQKTHDMSTSADGSVNGK